MTVEQLLYVLELTLKDGVIKKEDIVTVELEGNTYEIDYST